MKILITGHKGFIGSNAVQRFSDRHKVHTHEWEDGDLPSVKKYDWVMHFGAISSTTERDVAKIMRQNYDFSVELYRECRHHAVNFQFSSSASVYGLLDEFEEDSPVDPRTPYAWSKYMFEHYVKQHPPRHSVAQLFRYFNVYGPGEDHKGTQASPQHQFTMQALQTGKIRVFENSDRYHRDFVHVDRVLGVHEAMLKSDATGVFNVGTGQTQSFLDVAKGIAEEYEAKIEYIPMPDILKDSYQTYTCADLTHLNNTLEKI